MKICLIAESYPPALGGVEFALQNLVEGFVGRGHEVWVVTSSWQRHDAGVEESGSLRISRVKTLPFFHRLWFILFSLPTVLKAAQWADVVQGSTFAGGPPACFGGWIAGKKKVLIVHEVWGKRWNSFEPSWLRAFFYQATEWIIVRLPFDQYIAVSEYTKRCLKSIGVAESKTVVIHHGDSQMELAELSREGVRKELGYGTDDFLFLAYGRVGISKGFEYFAEAIPELVRRLPRARFVFVLSGYDQRIWRRIRRSLGGIPVERCTLLSSLPRSELARYVVAADSVVIPSLSEGFGFSALEACNAQKIVVSTDAGSLPEVISGRHVFVKAGDSYAFVEGCVRAFKGELEVVPRKEFSWEKAVASYLEVCERLLPL